ncbi:hypothetical protein [Bacillus sp. FJAT-27245]|uniref:hypothetical protein n=1 Tax=Bacillus sp. FJAT-27245 TaxID=1684144 RepID=UPI0006A7C9BB|nr:hypothetical protein [Bacillus sp. FJAT-27245]
MAKFEITFRTEPDENLVEIFKDEYQEYDFWGEMDIIIDGKSFFKSCRPSFYEKYYEMTSTISDRGITVPVFPMIEAILEGIDKIRAEGKTVIIEEYTGQIGKSMVWDLDVQEGKLVIAIMDCFFDEEHTWYDGREVSIQKEIPVSNVNVLMKEDVIEGSILSIKNYLSNLTDKYPELKEMRHFRDILKSAGLK